jgi:peptide subunit release factor RF-3
MTWPVGEGGEEFQGVYDRITSKVHLFERGNRKKKVLATIIDLNDSVVLQEAVGIASFFSIPPISLGVLFLFLLSQC